MPNYSNNAGLSMVELLVALAISSFLILGVTTIFIDNKRSYVFQQNQAENIESSRYTLAILQDQLAKAGYRRRPDVPLDAAFPASNALGCGFSAGQAAKQFSTSRDAICIRYQPRTDTDRDCLGNLPINTSILDDGPYIEGGEVVVQRFYRDNNALHCQVTHITATATTPASGELITGVADLMFEYGVGTASDARTVNSYTQNPTTPVLAIRYAALLRGSNANQREGISVSDALSKWLEVADLDDDDPVASAIEAADNGHLYLISQSAVVLRNLMP